MFKISLVLIITLATGILIGCAGEPRETVTPTYTGPTVSGYLESGCKKTTIKEVESFIDNKLPLPAYLPPGYEIQEVYYRHHPESSPETTSVYLLISDQPVAWNYLQYRCRLVLYIGWNHAGLGLKMPWAEFIKEAGGRLEQTEDEYVLWKETYGDAKSLGSTVRLYASREFSKDEIIKVAASIPSTRHP